MLAVKPGFRNGAAKARFVALHQIIIERHWLQRRFDLVLILYSFPKNERLRLRVEVGEHEPVTTVEGIWPTANWLEREVYDMFGIVFAGHSYLKRLLLPEEWQGYPLRKDYDILQQDEAWVRENLGIESGQ